MLNYLRGLSPASNRETKGVNSQVEYATGFGISTKSADYSEFQP